jgi:hypothetical protein
MERMRNCFKRAQRELQNLGKKSPFFYSVDELLERYHLTDVNSLQEEIAHTEQHLQRWINLFKEELDFMKRPRGDRPSHGLKEAVRSFFIDHFDEPPTNKQLKDIFSIANNPFQKDKASS